MILLMLLGFIVPLTLALLTIVTHAHDIVDWVESLATSAMSLPPHWLAHVSIAGPQLATKWSDAAAVPPAEIAARLVPYTRPAIGWVLRMVGSLGLLMLQLLLVEIGRASCRERRLNGEVARSVREVKSVCT